MLTSLSNIDIKASRMRNPFNNTHNEKFEQGHVIAATRTVTINPSFLETLTITRSSTPETTNSFLLISEERLKPDKTSVSDEFIFAESEKKNLLTDEQVTTLVNALDISFTAMPNNRKGVHTGWAAIEKKEKETDIAFAKRQLFAIRPPLLSLHAITDSSIGEKATALNEWHIENHPNNTSIEEAIPNLNVYFNEGVPSETARKFIDKALSETFYYFKDNKLVVRHAPIIATTEKNSPVAYQIIHDVTEAILKKIMRESKLTNNKPIHINHIIPHIEPGWIASAVNKITQLTNREWFEDTKNNSRHITIMVAHENFQYDELVQSENILYPFYNNRPKDKAPWVQTFDPRNIGAQNILNDIDCGRHVTVMATILMQLLMNQEDLQVTQLTDNDLTKHDAVSHAQYCTDPADLRRLLEKLAKNTHVKLEVDTEKLACVYAQLTFLIQKPTGSQFGFFSNGALTPEQKELAFKLLEQIEGKDNIPDSFLENNSSANNSPLTGCLNVVREIKSPPKSPDTTIIIANQRLY